MYQKNNSPFDRGAANTQANLECPFYKEVANMYQKTFTPFDIMAADTKKKFECPLFKEVAAKYKNIPLPLMRSLSCPCDSCQNLVIPVESSRIIFGRESCQNCHSGDHLFQQNRAIPELGPEWSQNGLEWNLVECWLHL